jgi:hypothetical protein
MAAIIELKYFNTFWLKKIKTITDVTPGVSNIAYASNSGATIIFGGTASVNQISVGQEFTITSIRAP